LAWRLTEAASGTLGSIGNRLIGSTINDARDLSVAGRVLLSSSGSEHITHRLVHLEKPLFRIPTLAIHLDHTQNEAFKFNRETEYRPIAGLIEKAVNSTIPTTATDSEESPIANRHHPELLSLLAQTVSESVETIQDFELLLYDTQPPCLGGFHDEFIFAPRLDNLCMSFCAVKALEESKDLENDDTLRLVSLFDNEVSTYCGLYLNLC
jgi:aspartyl aminopeptidase